jgi:hypothetical protein
MITVNVDTDIPPGPDAGPEDTFHAQVRVQHPVRTYTNDLPFGFIEIGGVRIRSYAAQVRQQFKADLRARIDSIEEALAIGTRPSTLKDQVQSRIEQLQAQVLADFLALEIEEQAAQHVAKAATVRQAQQFSNS